MNKVYEIITDKMIAALEAGQVPWHKPWKPSDGPRNIRGTYYRGVNRILLAYEQIEKGYKKNIWLTPQQAIELKGSFKGQKTTQVVFWKVGKATDEATGEEKTIFLLRYYNVLNIEQVQGIEIPADPETISLDPIESAEKVLREMPNDGTGGLVPGCTTDRSNLSNRRRCVRTAHPGWRSGGEFTWEIRCASNGAYL